LTKKKSKTKLIEENRDIRMFLDVLKLKIKNGEFDHVWKLTKSEYDTKKINNEWTTKTIISQMNLEELTKSIEVVRENNLKYLGLIQEQIINYNSLLNEKNLVMNNDEEQQHQLEQVEKKAKKSTQRFLKKSNTEFVKCANFNLKYNEYHEKYQLDNEIQELNKNLEHDYNMKTDPIYCLENRHPHKTIIPLPLIEFSKWQSYEKVYENILISHPDHPKAKKVIMVDSFFKECDKIQHQEKCKKENKIKKDEEYNNGLNAEFLFYAANPTLKPSLEQIKENPQLKQLVC